MEDRLLVVHPSKRYDRLQKTQGALIILANGYKPEDLFVVYDNAKEAIDDASNLVSIDEAKRYLKRWDIKNMVYSKYGKIEEPGFLNNMMEGCKKLTICGHAGNLRHHDSFLSVMDAFLNSPAEAIDLVLPTYAISSGIADDSGESMLHIIENSPVPNNFLMQIMVEIYRPRITTGGLSPKETATLDKFRYYVSDAVIRTYGKTSLIIGIDGSEKFNFWNNGSRKLGLYFENRQNKLYAK